MLETKCKYLDTQKQTVLQTYKERASKCGLERMSRFTVLEKIEQRTAAATEEAIVRLLKPYRLHTLTITFDNGKEFSNHQQIARQLEAEMYFAHLYASWERGTNENTMV